MCMAKDRNFWPPVGGWPQVVDPIADGSLLAGQYRKWAADKLVRKGLENLRNIITSKSGHNTDGKKNILYRI